MSDRTPIYHARGFCPYCGTAFDRDQFFPMDLATCVGCGRRYVSDVEHVTTVKRIEGEVTRRSPGVVAYETAGREFR